MHFVFEKGWVLFRVTHNGSSNFQVANGLYGKLNELFINEIGEVDKTCAVEIETQGDYKISINRADGDWTVAARWFGSSTDVFAAWNSDLNAAMTAMPTSIQATVEARGTARALGTDIPYGTLCKDGSLSPSTGSGTCSHHGGILK